MFQPFCVASSHGPHVTMQAGVEQAGRYWTSTARRSFKARSLRGRPVASLAFTESRRTVLLGGSVTVVDPVRPADAMADLGAALGAGAAVARLSVAHLQQLVGYIETSATVPGDWLPTGRVLLSMPVDRRLVIGEAWDVIEATGVWDVAPVTWHSGPPRHHAPSGQAWPTDLPPSIRELLVTPRPDAWAGVGTGSGPVVIPTAVGAPASGRGAGGGGRAGWC